MQRPTNRNEELIRRATFSASPADVHESTPLSELYNDAGRKPALPVLCLVSELSHKPICLQKAKSDPLAKPDIQTAADEHGKRVRVRRPIRNRGAAEQGVHEGLNYGQTRAQDGTDGIRVNGRIR